MKVTHLWYGLSHFESLQRCQHEDRPASPRRESLRSSQRGMMKPVNQSANRLVRRETRIDRKHMGGASGQAFECGCKQHPFACHPGTTLCPTSLGAMETCCVNRNSREADGLGSQGHVPNSLSTAVPGTGWVQWSGSEGYPGLFCMPQASQGRVKHELRFHDVTGKADGCCMSKNICS